MNILLYLAIGRKENSACLPAVVRVLDKYSWITLSPHRICITDSLQVTRNCAYPVVILISNETQPVFDHVRVCTVGNVAKTLKRELKEMKRRQHSMDMERRQPALS